MGFKLLIVLMVLWLMLDVLLLWHLDKLDRKINGLFRAVKKLRKEGE